jgi:hypothetical protein
MRTTIIAIAASLLPLGAYVHRGWSSYDAAKTTTITGEVDAVKWENPHAMAYVTHDGRKAEVHPPPNSLMVAHALENEALAIGKTATLDAYPSPASANEFRAERATVDGETIELP